MVQLTQGKLIPKAAENYAKRLDEHEMPLGLKQYLELELFPHIQLKCKKGISLKTAQAWLHIEGFKYTTFKKGLYFDGHDHPDVIEYCQNIFLPRMEEYFPRLLYYVMGDVEKESVTLTSDFVGWHLVLVAHDEMTAQANDSMTKSWVFENQHQLHKKGPGHGLHQSDVICSTYGWLKDAS